MKVTDVRRPDRLAGLATGKLEGTGVWQGRANRQTGINTSASTATATNTSPR